MRIYTRSGDKGTTSIHGGHRVRKSDSRIETNGILDELNSAIGMLRSKLPEISMDDADRCLRNVQVSLMEIMSGIATLSEERSDEKEIISDDAIVGLEFEIDRIQLAGILSQHFVLPSGCEAACMAHMARTICRRAERAMCRLDEEDPVDGNSMKYINRLSDLLFAFAREANYVSGNENEIWRSFGKGRRDE